MTHTSNWNYTSDVTFWTVTRDEFNRVTYGTPVVRKCSHMSGGRLTRDSSGQEFVPASTVYMEGDAPTVGMVLAVGNHATPPLGFQTIRVVRTFSPPPWDDGLADVVVMTG